jgi:hypothetical protein
VTARWADVPDGGSTSQPDRIERANSERSAIL